MRGTPGNEFVLSFSDIPADTQVIGIAMALFSVTADTVALVSRAAETPLEEAPYEFEPRARPSDEPRVWQDRPTHRNKAPTGVLKRL